MMRELYGPKGALVARVIVAEDGAVDRVDVYARKGDSSSWAGSITVQHGDGWPIAAALVGVEPATQPPRPVAVVLDGQEHDPDEIAAYLRSLGHVVELVVHDGASYVRDKLTGDYLMQSDGGIYRVRGER